MSRWWYHQSKASWFTSMLNMSFPFVWVRPLRQQQQQQHAIAVHKHAKKAVAGAVKIVWKSADRVQQHLLFSAMQQTDRKVGWADGRENKGNGYHKPLAFSNVYLYVAMQFSQPYRLTSASICMADAWHKRREWCLKRSEFSADLFVWAFLPLSVACKECVRPYTSQLVAGRWRLRRTKTDRWYSQMSFRFISQ